MNQFTLIEKLVFGRGPSQARRSTEVPPLLLATADEVIE